jgi:hypothetical protein
MSQRGTITSWLFLQLAEGIAAARLTGGNCQGTGQCKRWGRGGLAI